jgi:hypothetical protein
MTSTGRFLLGAEYTDIRAKIMARERSEAAAVESMAATGAGYRQREVASPGRPGTAQRLSVPEGAVVMLTIGGIAVHAKIVKVEQGSLLGSSKQRRSAKRNTRDAFEARRKRRASAAQVAAGGVPPGLGLEQQQVQEVQLQEQEQEQEQQEPPVTEAAKMETRAAVKRAAESGEEASGPAQRKQRVQEAQRSEEEATEAVLGVMCGRARAVEVAPAAKVARRWRRDDAASASVAARERRRQSARDAALGWSGVDESARYVFM